MPILDNFIPKRLEARNVILMLSIVFGVGILVLFAMQKWIIVAAILGFITLIIILYTLGDKPELIIVTCLVFQFIPIGRYIGFPLYVAFFIYAVLKRLHQNGKILSINLVSVAWLFLLILGVITLPKWNNYFSGLQWFMSLVIIPFILYTIIIDEHIKPSAIRWLLEEGAPIVIGFLVIITLILSTVTIIHQASNASSYNFLHSFRGIVVTGNGNNRLAGFLIFCVVYGFSTREFWDRTKFKKVAFSSILYIALALSLLFTSRGALISLFAATLVYFFGKYFIEKERQHKKKVKLYPIIAGILAIIIIAIITKPFIKFLIFRLQDYKNYSTLSRLVMWKSCLIKIKSGLFIGTGPGQYPWYGIGELLEDPHNILLRYGVEFGAIGMIFIGAILSYPFLLVARKIKISREETAKIFLLFAPALVGVFIHSMIDSLIGSRGMGPFIWLIWAIFIKYLLDIKKQEVK